MTAQDADRKLLIFLSHASQDKRQVRTLYKRLQEDGFDPWLDEERLLPGQDWDLEIEKALRLSDAILLCFSSLSVAKEGYIQREYKRAMRYLEEKPEGTIYVIPVRLDDCELPHFIREIQWVDYPDDYDKLVVALNLRAGGKPMTKKNKARKESAPPKKIAGPGKSGGTNITVHGSFNVGGDFIGGNQYKTVIQNETINNISTPADFISVLNQIKAEIDTLRSQPNVEPATARRLTAVEGDIEDVMAEAGKQKPVPERIKTTLEGAKEMMDRIEKSIGSALQLGSALGNLVLIVWKVFGG